MCLRLGRDELVRGKRERKKGERRGVVLFSSPSPLFSADKDFWVLSLRTKVIDLLVRRAGVVWLRCCKGGGASPRRSSFAVVVVVSAWWLRSALQIPSGALSLPLAPTLRFPFPLAVSALRDLQGSLSSRFLSCCFLL